MGFVSKFDSAKSPGSALLCGKGSIAAVSRAGTIGGHDPEMISGVRSQGRDVRADILVIVPSLGLVSGGVPIAGGRTILKVHSRC